jgi:hypothetical protein
VTPERPLAAFNVDVEDWHQSCIDFDAPITERVVRNVDRVLAVLDECDVMGTFFVQGRWRKRSRASSATSWSRGTRCSRMATATARSSRWASGRSATSSSAPARRSRMRQAWPGTLSGPRNWVASARVRRKSIAAVATR